MFVTASTELKFHQWPEDGLDEPYNLSITSEIVSLSWSKGNNFMIYLQDGGRPEILNLRDINNIKPIHVVTAIDHATAVTFQRNTKKVVAIGTSSSTVALYDTSTKSIVKLFTVPAAVTHLDFNVNDEFLAVACADGTISLLNIMEGNESCSYTVGSQPSILCFHPTVGGIFSVGTKDGTLFKFNVNLPNPMYVERCHFGSINGIIYSVKHELMLTAGEDSKFCVFDLNKNNCIYRGHLQFPLTSMDITPDGKHIAMGTDRGSVYIYETKNLLTPLLKWSPHVTRIRFVKFSNKPPAEIDSKKVLSDESVFTSDTISPDKLREENDFKSLYNKFINQAEDEDILNILREDILADIKKDAEQLRVHMRIHMASLQDFIKKEFSKMNEQMDEKWNFLRIVGERYKQGEDLTVEHIYYDHDEPIILE